jgi:beta-lactamase regulating signal transducer with metallopeptidase domain/HEAT repeat protein
MIDAAVDTVVLPMAKELGTAIVLKATVVLSAAALLTNVLKRESSAVRHAVWSAAFVILFVIPGVSMLLPSWRIEGYTLPAPRGGAATTIRVAAADRAPVPGEVRDAQSSHSVPAVAAPASQSAIDQPTSNRRTDVMASLAVSFWLWGALVLLSRLLVHAARVDRITRRARACDCPDINRLLRPLIESLNIKKPLRIVMSEEIAMPFAWGVFSPVVVFPSTARDWPAERKRSVLLHELAHVARHDYVIHIIVEVVKALYWPNPLVWLAAGWKSVERERACDDVALLGGTPGREYATHLLDVARLQVEPCLPAGAVTMTAKEGLVDRIRRAMDATLNRSPIRSDRMLLASIVVFLVSLPLGMLDVTASRWATPATEQLTAQLRGGENPRERSRAAWWLGEHEDRSGVGPLTQSLHDPSAGVRIAAAWALGEIKDENSIAPLIEVLKEDENRLVREMAALALGEIEDPSAVDPLVAAFADDSELRLAVVWALGEIERRGSRSARRARQQAFATMETSPWKNDQVWTGDLGGNYPGSKDVAALLESLHSEDAAQRRDAALSLGYLGVHREYDSTAEAERAVDSLLRALSDPVPEVRAAAVWSLDEINPSRWNAER